MNQDEFRDAGRSLVEFLCGDKQGVHHYGIGYLPHGVEPSKNNIEEGLEIEPVQSGEDSEEKVLIVSYTVDLNLP